jgi:hypothetical protein
VRSRTGPVLSHCAQLRWLPRSTCRPMTRNWCSASTWGQCDLAAIGVPPQAAVQPALHGRVLFGRSRAQALRGPGRYSSRCHVKSFAMRCMDAGDSAAAAVGRRAARWRAGTHASRHEPERDVQQLRLASRHEPETSVKGRRSCSVLCRHSPGRRLCNTTRAAAQSSARCRSPVQHSMGHSQVKAYVCTLGCSAPERCRNPGPGRTTKLV